eukprot:m.39292 g.39292  ORF g.39292 m.39292 type:complete len:453 (+) comp10294_c0_seq1:296-1654(+)
MMSAKRVCVIGAGPSGLGCLQAFATAEAKGDTIPTVVCFEKQERWGGLWNYTWRTGLDQNGEPVHGSMYRYLWSNGPKECLEMADYSFDEHYKQPIPSFPPRAVLEDYILGRAKKSNLGRFIKYSTAVRNVTFDGEAELFTVEYEDLTTHTRTSETFDNVIVAAGHFSVPNVPDFPGFAQFPGRILHVHDFRDAVEFKGKRVLIVGASYSAEDIGLQLHKYGAAAVTMSYRTQAMGFDWPDTMEELPLLVKVEGNTASFADGTTREVDAIILCTGYQHSFPFMEDSLRLRTLNRLCPDSLWKGVVWNNNEKLLYLGMQDQWYTFTMFDAQGWLARDIVMGKCAVPDKAAREADWAAWRAREEKAETAYQQIEFQTEYVRDVAAMSDYPKFDLDACCQMFKDWKGHKKISILGYRDYTFTSPVTGTVSPSHHTPWLQALDDSLECYMQSGKGN